MLFVLDTNVLSESLKDKNRITSRLHALDPSDDIIVPIVAWFEVIRGRMASVLTASSAEQLQMAQARLDHDLEAMGKSPIRGVNAEVAIYFEKPIGDKKARKMERADLLIACIALANKAVLVTRNVKDFAHVPGLAVQNWFE